MKLVVDANIILAALIKESISYELLFIDSLQLYCPEFIIAEIYKYKNIILKKTKKKENDFYRFLDILQRRINLIPLEELIKYIETAEKISPDPKDTTYLALALKLNIPLWTNDKTLKSKQNQVLILHTHELLDLL